MISIERYGKKVPKGKKVDAKYKYSYQVIGAIHGRRTYQSELFTQKPAVWKNILANMKDYNSKSIIVHDNAATERGVFKVTRTGNKIKYSLTNIKPIKQKKGKK